MELNKIGLMIGILAMVLAVPLAIMANLLTPRAREWYSTTSQKRMRKRLAKVEAQLRASELWVFSNAEWETYSAIWAAMSIPFLGFHIAFSFIMMGLMFYGQRLQQDLNPSRPHGVAQLATVILMGYAFNIYFALKATSRLARNRETRTEKGRAELRVEVERLNSLIQR